MTTLFTRPPRQPRQARRWARRAGFALAGTAGLWVGLALVLVFMVIAAAIAATNPPVPGPAPTAQGGSVTAPPGGGASLRNAAAIVNVAYRRGLDAKAAAIGVAVAIAESSLLNYANDGTSPHYGHFAEGRRQLNAAERTVARESLQFPHDAVGRNLDSIGLFQQRPSAGWGTPAELIDPTTAASKFFDALQRLDGWQAMDPAAAAQTVQGSNDADGGIYRSAYTEATGIVAQLSPASGSPAASGGAPISGGVQVAIPPGNLAAGTITAPNPQVAAAVAAGLARIGTPYSWGGGDVNGPTTGICGAGAAAADCRLVGFDCSGLLTYMWAHAGITVSSYSVDQMNASTPIPWSQKAVGDMVGYDGHISMYIGTFNGVEMELEAPYSGEYVRIDEIGSHHHPNAYRLWDTP